MQLFQLPVCHNNQQLNKTHLHVFTLLTVRVFPNALAGSTRKAQARCAPVTSWRCWAWMSVARPAPSPPHATCSWVAMTRYWGRSADQAQITPAKRRQTRYVLQWSLPLLANKSSICYRENVKMLTFSISHNKSGEFVKNIGVHCLVFIYFVLCVLYDDYVT